MTAPIDPIKMDPAEQLASVRRHMAQIERNEEEMVQRVANFKPWRTFTSGMLFGAALSATAMVFTKHFL